VVSFVSVSSSSIGLGGGVVAIVHPIQAPMNIIARKAMRTTVAIAPNWICWVVQGSHGSVLFISSGAATVPTYAAETIMHARQIVVPIVWSLFMFSRFFLFSVAGSIRVVNFSSRVLFLFPVSERSSGCGRDGGVFHNFFSEWFSRNLFHNT